MGSIKDMRKDKIHNRTITVNTYKADDACIIVEGQLKDDKLIETNHYNGSIRPAKIIHNLIIRLLIDSRLTIKDVEVEMPETPHEECPDTKTSLQQIVGMRISRGFSVKVKDLFTQGTGCSHLIELILAMAPTAVQGFWTAISSKPLPDNLRETMKLMLIDTCWVWRSDGPAIKNLSV